MCKPILSEIHAALKEKFNWRTAEIDDALAGYSLETIMVQLHGALQGACRDPNDDMILECAVLAGAEIVVTGDKDLLALNPFEKIQILTPRDFLSLLGPGESAAP
jgi:putative PIN family toxin of toxin-antitoxin system